MAKGSGGGGRSGGRGSANRSAALAQQMTDMRGSKPRSLQQTFGSRGPTPEQKAAYDSRVKAWNRDYRKLQKEQKTALEEDNKAFRARQARQSRRRR